MKERNKGKTQLHTERDQIRKSTSKGDQVKEKLPESDEQFKQFFENAPVYCYMISTEGIILNVNNAALEVLGYEKQELIGKPLRTIYAPESLPKMKQLLAKWQETGKLRDEEIVIISKEGNRRSVILSTDAVKDDDGKVLHSVSVQRDITERKRVEETLREMATIDPLTSLYNRRRFSEFLDHEIDRAKRYKTDLSIIMFDIDHFKKINDTYGHGEGDNVLRMLGARMKDIVRKSDIVARWGGEEFIVLAVNTNLRNAQIVAEKIRSDVENLHLTSGPGFTVSAGVAQFNDKDDANSLINRADKALYQAKNSGRNQVQAA